MPTEHDVFNQVAAVVQRWMLPLIGRLIEHYGSNAVTPSVLSVDDDWVGEHEAHRLGRWTLEGLTDGALTILCWQHPALLGPLEFDFDGQFDFDDTEQSAHSWRLLEVHGVTEGPEAGTINSLTSSSYGTTMWHRDEGGPLKERMVWSAGELIEAHLISHNHQGRPTGGLEAIGAFARPAATGRGSELRVERTQTHLVDPVSIALPCRVVCGGFDTMLQDRLEVIGYLPQVLNSMGWPRLQADLPTMRI